MKRGRKKWIIFACLFIVSFCALFAYHSYTKELEEQRLAALYQDAQGAVATLFDEQHIVRSDVAQEDVDHVYTVIDLVEIEEQKDTLKKEVAPVEQYIHVRDQLYSFFDEDILRSSVSSKELDALQTEYEQLSEQIQALLQEKVQDAYAQKQAILDAEEALAQVWTQEEGVQSDVERADYEHVLELFENLPQQDLLAQYQEPLETILSYIERVEQERIEAERKRLAEEQRKREQEEANRIAAANHILYGVPFISQKQAQVYNGCEVAALLMGLQYRGYATNMSLADIANDVPKSDNPHLGFVSEIFTYAPSGIVHWIAPDALASYGRTLYANVQDISGSSPADLKAHINAGNPVIVYGTDGYRYPTSWDGEVPMNLHVQLLIGYNDYKNTYTLYDPYYGQLTLPAHQFESIYNLMRFAVAIQ